MDGLSFFYYFHFPYLINIYYAGLVVRLFSLLFVLLLCFVIVGKSKFELADGSYSVSDIQNYFEYIIKKDERVTANPPVRIYVNKIENRITFKINIEYHLEVLTPKMMKLVGSTK